MTRIKICCISSLEEANLAIQLGASVIGLVGAMPSGPGVIGDVLIKSIATDIPSSTESFLLMSESTSSAIIEHWNRTKTSAIQIVSAIDLDEYLKIRAFLPEVKLVQVVHVENKEAIAHALEIEDFVDAILLDSGKPSQGILGGTGNTHNWQISRKIVHIMNIHQVI